ncbi:Retrovirus-related Pol poly from transposon TNT 1-94 [Solea senegalensis]|uniref:Retrovirus-related Pol poly from transposon TNT 1-94 n=1 Tax=Solea senegalensis TaxID=28829 RepID=A0AAV6T1T4_SOLSE|nr:Retrovirus-related Pol poly from transposon TNT 1-94 [Solea senegalensis]
MSTQVRGEMQANSKAVGTDKSSWRCYKCGKEGHIKRAWPSWKKKKKIHKAKSVMCEDEEDSSESAFVANEANQNDMEQQVQWLVDFGASKHMTCHEEIFQDYQQFPKPQSVKLGDGRVVDALGLGNVKLRMTFKVSDGKNVTMYDVLYVPKLSGNLFSLGAAVRKGNTVQFNKSHCYIRGKDGDLKGKGRQRADGLYQLDVEGSSPVCRDASSASVAVSLWQTGTHHQIKGTQKSDTERRKLDKKAVKLRFMGYANNSKGYRLLHEEKRRILIHRDVIFNGSDFGWKQEDAYVRFDDIVISVSRYSHYFSGRWVAECTVCDLSVLLS